MTKGRPRKAQINDVVLMEQRVIGAVMIEYRPEPSWDRYRVIRTDPVGRYPFGKAIWIDSTDFTRTGITSKRPGIVYRHNQRLGGDEVRGCACNCCHHVAGIEAEPKE